MSRDPDLKVNEHGVETLFVDGNAYATGLKPSPRAALAALPPFGASNPIVPRSEWPTSPGEAERALEAALPVLDQGSVGACEPHGGVTSFNKLQVQAGRTLVRLSPWTAYALINGGRDAGSSPSDFLAMARDKGLGLDSDNPQRVYYKNRLPSTALQNAARFKVADAYLLGEDIDEWVSALLLGYAINFGMQLPRGYGSVGRDGVVPKGGYGGLHAQAFLYAWLDPATGRPKLRVQNSWRADWGDGGRADLDEDHIFAGYSEGLAFKVISDDPQDPKLPPAPIGV